MTFKNVFTATFESETFDQVFWGEAGGSPYLDIAVSSLSYTSNSSSDLSSTDVKNMWVDPAGNYLYILDVSEDIIEFEFGTANDVTTLAATGNTLAGGDSGVSSIALTDDGSYLYAVTFNSDVVKQWSLSTPFDLSTASSTGDTLSVASETPIPVGLAVSGDGTRILVSDNSSENVYSYTLSTPNDLTSGSYDSKSFGLTAQAWSLWINNDGTTLLASDFVNNIVRQYDMTTGYDLDTISANGSLDVDTQGAGDGVGMINSNATLLAISAAGVVYEYE